MNKKKILQAFRKNKLPTKEKKKKNRSAYMQETRVHHS